MCYSLTLMRITARQRPNGLWEARATVYGTRKSWYGKSKEEAIAYAEGALATANSASWTATPSFKTFTQLAYIPTIVDHSQNWVNQIVWALDGHIYPAFGRRPLDEIKRADIQAFLMAKMSGTGALSRASVGHLRKVMFAVFSLAEADELLARNPVAKVKLPPARKVHVPPYSIEECSLILKQAEGHLCYNGLYCAMTLGLRIGECLGLQWKDIRGQKIHIARQHDGEPLKTESANRTLPLPAGWIEGLEPCSGPWISPERSERNLAGRPTKKKGELIMTGRGYYRMTELAGLPYKNFHRLRVTVATTLEEELCPQGLIGAILGHTSGSVTRLYIHNSDKLMRESLQKVYDRLQAGGTPSGVRVKDSRRRKRA